MDDWQFNQQAKNAKAVWKIRISKNSPNYKDMIWKIADYF